MSLPSDFLRQDTQSLLKTRSPGHGRHWLATFATQEKNIFEFDSKAYWPSGLFEQNWGGGHWLELSFGVIVTNLVVACFVVTSGLSCFLVVGAAWVVFGPLLGHSIKSINVNNLKITFRRKFTYILYIQINFVFLYEIYLLMLFWLDFSLQEANK